jgi:hypothetical protein
MLIEGASGFLRESNMALRWMVVLCSASGLATGASVGLAKAEALQSCVITSIKQMECLPMNQPTQTDEQGAAEAAEVVSGAPRPSEALEQVIDFESAVPAPMPSFDPPEAGTSGAWAATLPEWTAIGRIESGSFLGATPNESLVGPQEPLILKQGSGGSGATSPRVLAPPRAIPPGSVY